MRLVNFLAEIASLFWLCYNERVPFLTVLVNLFYFCFDILSLGEHESG